MQNLAGNYFGSSIDNTEIATGTITIDKFAASAISALNPLPVGCVVAFLKTLTGCPSLPSTFVECNGQTLTDAASPFNGQVIPNLNGASAQTQRFLRGAAASGNTGGTETHTHTGGISPSGSINNGSGYSTSFTTNATSTLPSYYEVVWVMRIK